MIVFHRRKHPALYIRKREPAGLSLRAPGGLRRQSTQPFQPSQRMALLRRYEIQFVEWRSAVPVKRDRIPWDIHRREHAGRADMCRGHHAPGWVNAMFQLRIAEFRERRRFELVIGEDLLRLWMIVAKSRI